jgi:tetratricopeptide (TPR) repeat protein
VATTLPCSEGHQWQPLVNAQSRARPQRFCAVCGLVENVASPAPTEATSAGSAHTAPSPGAVTSDLSPLAETLALPPAQPQSPAGKPPSGTIPVATPVDTAASDSSAATAEAARVPGYEITGVLGRGGMGVVYRAVQISLKRPVALKMILGGSHASEVELARFRTEAEAVAKLQHPNIVQIYEIGSQNGLPYFSLELVDGSNLAARINGKPLPPTEAAQLLLTLARAMHHSHQKAIVHRDLKPANVLLMADGTPKITDFGLAKQLEGEPGQTKSGAVLGTPSYMAPEQAAGRMKDIGPRTDVYALGAVLFEMLTGSPPFRGESPMDTLLQVVSNEPVPPTRLQPRVPRDLETICLKALAKEPAARYHSALALAQDLERFLAGEPILGRRESLPRKLWRKAKRSPVAAAALAGVVVALLVGGIVAARIGSARERERLDRQAAQKQTEIAEKNRAFEAGLNAADWGPEQLTKMEGLASDIDRLAPGQGAAARQRLYQRFAAALRDSFSVQKKPVLEPADVTRISAAIDLLAARDAPQAAAVRKELADRAGTLDLVLDLQNSWNKLTDVFAAPLYEVDPAKRTLLSRVPGAGVIGTRTASSGDVELEAVFSSWLDAPQIGLALSRGPQGETQYALVLTVTDPVAPAPGQQPAPPPKTLGESLRRAGGAVSMQILRNGVRVREQAVWVSGTSLILRGIRRGDRVTFQVRAKDDPKVLLSMEFDDLFPFGASQGSIFGLYWPAGVRLEGLKAWRQALPAAPSPLQRGDDFYAQGRFDDALAEYRRARDGAARQEARCKEGLCLSARARLDEAAAVFREVAHEQGPRWPVVAGCELWVLLAGRQRFADADEVCRLLSAHPQARELARLVPVDVATRIRVAYRSRVESFTYGASVYAWIRADPERARDLDRALAAERLLEGDSGAAANLQLMKLYCMRGFHVTGQTDRALQTAEELLALPNLHPYWRMKVIQEYVNLSICRGDPDRALAVVNKWLVLPSGTLQAAYLPLLLERARLHAAKKNWEPAEKDAELVIRLHPQEESILTESYLLLGFLRERRGDADGAREAWKQGWSKIKGTRALYDLTGSTLGALADEITEKEIGKLLDGLIAGIDRSSPFATVIKNDLLPVAFVTAVSKERYRSPRGKEFARRVAYRAILIPEGAEMLFGLTIYEALHQGAVTGTLTAEQDALLWKLTTDMFQGYRNGKYNEVQGFQFAQAWIGTTNLLGWGGLKPGLDAGVRGPLAYVLGHRYRQLKKPQEAADFFKQALADAPEKSALREMARAELEKK